MDRLVGAATALREHAIKLDARSGDGSLDNIFGFGLGRV